MVALTEIDICKMALDRLRHTVDLSGMTELADLDPTATTAEEALAFWYPITLAELMEKVAWQPQTIDAELTLLQTDDGTQPWSGKWGHEFRYPDDAADLRAVRIPGSGRKKLREDEFSISSDDTGRVIRANNNPLNVEYVQNPEDPTVYGSSILFCKAVAMRLAWNIAPKLGINDQTRAAVATDYLLSLAEAQSKDANEPEDGDEPDGDFAAARRAG